MLFLYIKKSLAKTSYLYLNVNKNYHRQRKILCIFLYIQKEKIAKHLYISTKIQTLCKKQDNSHYVFINKNPDTLRSAIFMKFLKLTFIYIYKNHDTLRYVTFLYTKSQTSRKKQDNLC